MKTAIFKWSLIVAALVTTLLLTIANFSETTSTYRCEGAISSNDDGKLTTAYLKLTEYHWWVHLWSNNDANIRLEVPSLVFPHMYFSDVKKLGDIFQIYDLAGNQQIGVFSNLSKTLRIRLHNASFEGECS